MPNQDKQYTIYLRSANLRVPCTKQQFDDYYRDINAYRRTQMNHGRCVCPPSKRLQCDMDCCTCPHRTNGAATEETPVNEPPLTLEQVRAVLAEKSRNGHTAEIRTLLRKYGAAKLSLVDPAHYKNLLRDAEVLPDAT